ncbi:MAG: hypothetical protein MUF50_00085 [Planctomycetes bacterium]|jgi:hypothetical protein|nr:hypothetical protein [Planctomycetota bacterium]
MFWNKIIKKNTENNNYFTFKHCLWILGYILFFLLFLKNSYSYLNPDLGWHLKDGQEIWLTKEVPRFDHFDYTIMGGRWVDHEWLSNLLTYLTFNYFGYPTVNIFFSLLVIIVFALLHREIRKENSKADFFILPFFIIGYFAIGSFMGVRMQEFTFLFLTLLLLILKKYELACSNKKKNYFFILFWLLPLFWLWAMLHGGFLFGGFVLGFWLIIKTVENILRYHNFKLLNYSENNTYLSLKQIKVVLFFALGVFLVTLLTPYNIELYKFLLNYRDNYYQSHISEWLSQSNYPFHYWGLLYLGLFLSGLVTYFYAYKKIGTSWWRLGLTLILLIMSFKSRRHVPLFFVASLPLTIHYYYSLFEIKKIVFNKYVSLFLKTTVIITVIFLITCVIPKINLFKDPFTNFCQSFPCAAIQFLKDHPEYNEKRIFNNYGWGGFMIWTYPERKLFIDGRLPQYPINGTTFLREYYNFFDKDLVESKLNQYNIGLIMIEKNSNFKFNWFERFFFEIKDNDLIPKENSIITHLNNSGKWRIIYEDKISIIYLKP